MDILLVLLACFGLTNILVNSEIMFKFREWAGKITFFKELLSCSMCTGFWVGLYFSILLVFLLILESCGVSLWMFQGAFYLLTIPFASSGVSWLLERLAIILDVTAHKLDNED
jgi:hypothetical protein|tara:strand:+ start:26585 stop:26923 length:339 start_codon:yes stop_codon:yes gene_type:complete